MRNPCLEANLLQQLAAMRVTVLHKIFLGLQKAYNALDRDSCPKILVRYDVGSRAIWLLRTYWDGIKMVVKAGGYYSPPFKGYCGVTQV